MQSGAIKVRLPKHDQDCSCLRFVEIAQVSTEKKGRVKTRIWLRPTCQDDGETFRLGQLARADFKLICRAEHEAFHVASADLIGEALEASELHDAPTE